MAQGQPDTKKPAKSSNAEAEDSSQQRNRPGKTPLVILGIVVIILLIAAIIYYIFTRNLERTDDAYTDGNVVTMAPKVSGYIVELDIDDNMRVHAGDLLLKIDPRDYIVARDQASADLDLAKAQLESARANLAIARVEYPAKLAQAQAQKEAAQATEKQATAQAKRERSVDMRATTQQNIDVATQQAVSASSQVASTQAELQIAKLVPQNIATAEAQVKQLDAQVKASTAKLAQAELNLSYTEIRAPQDGWISRRNVQLGTYVQAGQSMFTIVTADVWVIANFKENQLDRMRPGQRVSISVDAYPGLSLKGYVQSLQMGTGSRFSMFPAENATGNYIKIVQRIPVKIIIDQGVDPNIPLPVGLSVDPVVTLK